jgi:hypothetical protein
MSLSAGTAAGRPALRLKLYRSLRRCLRAGGLLCLAQPAFAQGGVGHAATGGRTNATDSVPSRAAVVVSARPREFTIARVAVPATMPVGEPVAFEIRALGGATIISRVSGALPAATDARALLITFGVPARASAGRAPVAEVLFTTRSGLREVVRVEVEIAMVHALRLDLLQQAVGSKPGGQIVLRYRLTNGGNAADTVAVRYDVPHDWKVSEQIDRNGIVVPKGASLERQAVVHVPNSANGGSFSIEIHAANLAGVAQADEKLYVEIPSARQGPGSKAIAIATSISSTTGSAGGGSALMGLSFGGTLYRDVSIAVDATSAPALSEQGRYRLSSLGQFPQPPNVMFSAGPGRLRIGGVGASFSELTGQGAGGRGVSLGWESPTLSVKSAFAGPRLGFGAHAATSLDELEAPIVAGARVSKLLTPGLWVTGTVAHLDEGSTLFSRKLDVVGVGTLMPALFGGALESEVAVRKYSGGSGLGLFSEYTRTSARERMQFRALYAPGGATAYAGANGSLSGSLSHALSERWQLGTQGWYTRNHGSNGEAAHSMGASLSPQHFLRKDLSVGLDLGGSAQSLESQGVHFGSKETHASTMLNYALGAGTSLNVASTIARITRGLSFDSLQAGDLSSGRASLVTQISKGTERFGTLVASALMSRDESNTVGLPRQNQLILRLDRFPIYFPGGSYLYATGLVQRLGWFGDRPSIATLRGDITAELPLNFSVSFTADRNPQVSVPGTGPWSTSLRLSRTNYLTVPSFLRYGARRGLVFQDLDGNGVQDAGERGMGGVIVRRGDQQVTTEEDGSFKLANTAGQRTERLKIDPRTLPAGWMEKGTPLSEAEGKKVQAIGIIPTSSVRLHFIANRADLGVAGALDFTRIVVAARDSLGRSYLAQPVDSTTQLFAALPPGTYQVNVDPSSAGAQLQVSQAPTTFRVGAERTGHDYEVLLATRTVKLKTFGASSSAGDTERNGAPATLAAGRQRAMPGALPRRSTGAVADTVSLQEAARSRPPATPIPSPVPSVAAPDSARRPVHVPPSSSIRGPAIPLASRARLDALGILFSCTATCS